MKIDIENITMIYPSGKKALSDVSFHAVSPGFIGILGPNGAGKTTLMKLLIAGLIPTKGEILLNDKPLLPQEKELKAQLGYLPQSFGLFDELKVTEFLDYMAALKGISGKDEIRRVLACTGLEEQKKTPIRQLSGGQRQRVGIAQALLGNPQLMILDEPTVGLDPEERVRFRNIFSELAQDKIVLLSTHIIDDVQAVCSRVLIIDGGRILFDGEPSALVEQTEGKVGVYVAQTGDAAPEGCHIVSKVNVSEGVLCRITGDHLPDYAEPVRPTLEDAYLCCIHKGART